MLNRLHRLLPEGLVADAAWFSRMGYPSSLAAAATLRAVGCNRWRGGCFGVRFTSRGLKRRQRRCVGNILWSRCKWCWSARSRWAGARRWNCTASRTTCRARDRWGGSSVRGRTGAGVARQASHRHALRVSQCPQAVSRRADRGRSRRAQVGDGRRRAVAPGADPRQPDMAVLRRWGLADRAVDGGTGGAGAAGRASRRGDLPPGRHADGRSDRSQPEAHEPSSPRMPKREGEAPVSVVR